MKIFKSNTGVDVEYSVTPTGMFFESVATPIGSLCRGTFDVEKFLKWMLAPEIEREELQLAQNLRFMRMINWWEHTDSVQRGNFNIGLYHRVCEAKKGRGNNNVL